MSQGTPLIKPFQETTAVVTGSSSGIGRSIAHALAAEGCDRQVVHFNTNETGAIQTAATIGNGAIVAPADFSIRKDRERFVETAFGQLGRIDTWVFNAGADVLTGEARNLPFHEKLQRLLKVDVVGTIELARMVADRMQTQPPANHPPSLTFIGWDQAAKGMEGDAGQLFGPTKAAVMAFAMSLAQDLSPKIRVNVVAPGWIQTAWGDSAGDHWDRRARSQSLMQRWGKTEDVAKAVVYAAMPENTFLAGQILEINGGWNRKPQ